MSETPRDQRELWHEVSRTFEELGEALRVHLSADAARSPSDPTTPRSSAGAGSGSPGRPGEGAGASDSDWVGSADAGDTESAPWADPGRPGESEGYEDPWAAATDLPPRPSAPGSGTGARSGTDTTASDAVGGTDATAARTGTGPADATAAGAGDAAGTGTGPSVGADTTGPGAAGPGATGPGATGAATTGAGTTGAGTSGTGTSGTGTSGAGPTGTGAGGAGTTGAGTTGAGTTGAGPTGASTTGASGTGADGTGADGTGAGGAQERGWRDWSGAWGGSGGRFASPADWDSARESVRDLSSSVRRIATQAGDAARDPHVRDSAQRAARSLSDAIFTTVEDFATELRDRMRTPRWSDPSSPPEPPSVAPIEDNRDDKP